VTAPPPFDPSLVLGGVRFGLPEFAAGAMAVGLTAYVLTGGADFGGGVWDLLASGPRRDAQRALVAEAIGPIWEANHVWLILVVVLCFTCFPAAFAALSTVLHIPLTLMLVGVVLRGSAFVFRAYDVRRDAVQRRWGLVFSVSSLVTPVLLGVCLGAVAGGAVGAATAAGPADPRGFVAHFVRPWATPFAASVGALVLALFALLAAVYLTVEAAAPGTPAGRALARDFARRGLAALVATAVCAAAALALAPPRVAVSQVVAGGAWAAALQGVTLAAAAGTALALRGGRWRLARFAAQGLASCLLWGWAWAQFPDVIPPGGTAAALAAPPVTLALALGTLGAGTLVLLPSFVYLFRVFKRAGPAGADAAGHPPGASAGA
jgi:cytochrome d ubiquinol oxidase subunit II